jgi:hypothetical protein
MNKPTSRECEIADVYADSEEAARLYAQMLADFREELLRPFDELLRDCEAMRDERMAKWLDALLRTARGTP